MLRKAGTPKRFTVAGLFRAPPSTWTISRTAGKREVFRTLRGEQLFNGYLSLNRAYCFDMRKTNCFERPYSVQITREFLGASAAWWGSAALATGCFAFAITWLLA